MATTNSTRENDSLYNRFKSLDDKTKKKIFKTKLLRNKEFCTCDVCGERIKIGSLSLYSSYFNMKGHSDHVMEFIQNTYRNQSKVTS
jgi:hypothetical protein